MSHRVPAGVVLGHLSPLDLFLEFFEIAQILLFLSGVGFVALLVLIALFTNSWVHTLAHDGLRNTALDILVCYTGFPLELF